MNYCMLQVLKTALTLAQMLPMLKTNLFEVVAVFYECPLRMRMIETCCGEQGKAGLLLLLLLLLPPPPLLLLLSPPFLQF